MEGKIVGATQETSAELVVIAEVETDSGALQLTTKSNPIKGLLKFEEAKEVGKTPVVLLEYFVVLLFPVSTQGAIYS